MVEVEVKKWGNSKAIVVPANIADNLGIQVGDIVEADIVKRKKATGFGILKHKKYKPYKREGNWDLHDL